MPLRVTVWNEHVHERRSEQVRAVYPDGIHAAVAEAIRSHHGDGVRVRTATLAEPEHGLTEEVLADTDVLTWWGHVAHDEVDDAVADRVCDRVRRGMGLVVLHSGHYSKPFTRLMGTTCSLRWRDSGDRELVWTVDPTHPVVVGVPAVVSIPEHEMYGEFFDIPPPDELVFISSFTGGEVFRSGCGFRRGAGRIFYFSPGHETYPVYHQPAIRRIIANAVAWAHNPNPPSRDLGDSPQSPAGWFGEVG
jgi:trehalose utilization protein